MKASCAACGSTQPYGRIRCDQCGGPLVFPAAEEGVHRFKLMKCPACGKKLDAASSLFTDEQPQEGDVMVCFGCAEPLIFTDDHALRLAGPFERAEIMADPELIETVAAIKNDLRKRQ